MSDENARAVGAATSLDVGGEWFDVSPIGFRQLQEIQREAVRYYKRQYLQTFADNIDLLGNGDGQQLLQAKMEECARWGIDDLPAKTAYATDGVKLNAKLKRRLEQEYGDLPGSDRAVRALLATALDADKVTLDEVEQLTKTRPRRGQVEYDAWWVTAVYEGMVAFVWASLSQRHPELTREEIAGWPLGRIAEVAREVEQVTTPDLGNT